MAAKVPVSGKLPVIRSFALPNGGRIVSLRESTLRAGVNAANAALKAERAKAATRASIPAKQAS